MKRSFFNCLFAVLYVFSVEIAVSEKLFENESQDQPSLTLYFLPTPAGFDWSSPSSLLSSLMTNEMQSFFGYTHTIGHVFMRIDSSSQEKTVYTGITNINNDDGLVYSYQGDEVKERDLLMVDGVGLGLMFYQFRGVLNREEQVISKIHKRAYIEKHPAAPGRISFAQFLISEKTATRLFDYVEHFQKLEDENTLRYGLVNNPLLSKGGNSQGAGCSAFAKSFLDIAGISDEFANQWKVQLSVDRELVGGDPQDYMSVIKEKKEILMSRISSSKEWKRNSPLKLIVWDVDRMHQWVIDSFESEDKNHLKGVHRFPIKERVTYGYSLKGIVVDTSQVPTPTSQFFVPKTE